MMLEIGGSPRTASSSRRVIYRASEWKVHEFVVWNGGGAVCRCAALRVQGSVLVWLGASDAAPRLGDAALALPAAGATQLLGGAVEGAAVPLARRLARLLSRPVYVCCGATFDRFTLPFVERALVMEIKNRPECFKC